MIEDLDYKPILKKAASRGGELAELFLEERVLTEIQMEAGRLERVSFGMTRGAGVRLISGLRTRYAFTNSLLKKDLLKLAAAVAESADKDAAVIELPMEYKQAEARPVSKILKPPDRVAVKEKVEMIRRAEAVARKFDPRIVQVKVRYLDLTRAIGIANTLGVTVSDSVTQLVFMVQVIAAKDHDIQVGYESVGGTVGFELFEKEQPEAVALRTAQKAIMMLLARKAPGGKMPVVLSSEAGGTMIHEAIGHGLEADLAEQGLSVYQNQIGKKIASALVSVADDKTLPNKRGSYRFDDEGTPSERTLLVDKGVLKNYMYDRLEAMRARKVSTGNGRRESYRFRPIVRMSNTMILPGEMKPEEIIKTVDKGLLVRKMGGGEVDTVSGNFVFEVSEGYLIEKGKQAEPVRGATLVGNGPKVLQEIDMVGSDLGFGIGTCGKDGQGAPVADAQPTLRIPEITVGGELG